MMLIPWTFCSARHEPKLGWMTVRSLLPILQYASLLPLEDNFVLKVSVQSAFVDW